MDKTLSENQKQNALFVNDVIWYITTQMNLNDTLSFMSSITSYPKMASFFGAANIWQLLVKIQVRETLLTQFALFKNIL